MEQNLLKYLDFAQLAVQAGRSKLTEYFGKIENIEEKEKAGLVSEADREAEAEIIGVLRSKTPDFSILGEETGVTDGDPGFRWIVDPLDGTTNYVHQLPFFAVSLGLEIDGKIKLGVVDAPLLNKNYSAVSGGGAFLNENPIRVTKTEKFEDCLFATGFAGVHSGEIHQQMQCLEKLLLRSRGLRRYGSAALDLCMVAEGCFDGFFETNLQAWDVAAGAIIAMEAGASVTTYQDKEFDPFGKSIVATNGLIHKEVLELLDLSNC